MRFLRLLGMLFRALLAPLRRLFQPRPRAPYPVVTDSSPFLYQVDRTVGDRYRTLAWMLDQLRRKRPFQVVTITSSTASEGKSTVAVNLAAVLVERDDNRVLLIDCDLRRPRIQHLLGEAHPALQDLLEGRCTFDEAVHYAEEVGVYYIPAAGPAEEPFKLLASSKGLDKVLAQARRRFDFIILDSPPVLPVSDPRYLAEVADAVLFVVRAGETSGRLLSRSLNLLRKEKLLGIVFNGTARSEGYAYDPYYRRYAEGKEYARYYGHGAGRTRGGDGRGYPGSRPVT